MSTVTLRGLRKEFKKHVAVRGVDLDVLDGEFLILLGPSGCGKTTVLRMIAGLESPSQGLIRIGERDVQSVAAGDRDVAMVFQSYALYPHFDVRRNLMYGLRRRKTPKRVAEERVAETAKMLGIYELLDRRPGELSGGQRQRVALGRAIVREPSVFLMDEPLSNLDAKLRVQMRDELIRLHRELAITTVYVTHDQVEAMTMGDRIVVMSEGEIQQIGPPLVLYNAPANRFVASFLGSPQMNEFHGTLSGGGSGWQFKAGALCVSSTSPVPETRAEQVVLGVRPQALRVVEGERPSGCLPFDSGIVVSVEHLGSESFVVVEICEYRTTCSIRPGQEVPIGGTVSLYTRESDLFLFDAKTGTRLDTISPSDACALPGSIASSSPLN